jgi:hypothetical protein
MEFHSNFWPIFTVKMQNRTRSRFSLRRINKTVAKRDFQYRHIRPRGTGRQPADGFPRIVLRFLRKFVDYTDFGSNLTNITDDLHKTKHALMIAPRHISIYVRYVVRPKK